MFLERSGFHTFKQGHMGVFRGFRCHLIDRDMNRGRRLEQNKRQIVKEIELELHTSKKGIQERKSERRDSYGDEQKFKRNRF